MLRKPTLWLEEKVWWGTSPMVQWLRFHTSNPGGADSIPDWRTEIPLAMRCSQKKKAWWTYTPKENDGRSLFNMEGSDWAEQKKIEVVIKRETINISFKLGPLMKWKGILCNCFPGTKCVKWDLSWANRGILFSRYYSVLAWSSFIDYKNRKY